MLVPYTRRWMNHSFPDFDELERAFWGNSSLSEFRTDIQDAGDRFVLEADLPGFNKDDIHVDLNGDNLTISATRHSEYEQKDKKGNYVQCERSYGAYTRNFRTDGIDKSAIKASYRDGVLRLDLPKLAEETPKTQRLAIE